MSVPLYLPTETEAGALAFAAGIDTGRIPCLREYLDEHLARENFAKYPGGISKLLGIFRVENGAAVRVAEGAQRVGPGAFAGDQRGNDVSRSLGFPLAGGAGLNGTVLAPTASMTDRRDGGCVSGNPDPVSEEDGASTRADADRRRCNRAALLRSNSVDGRHVA